MYGQSFKVKEDIIYFFTAKFLEPTTGSPDGDFSVL